MKRKSPSRSTVSKPGNQCSKVRSHVSAAVAATCLLAIPGHAQNTDSRLVFSSYLGGSGVDDCDGIAVGADRSVYLGCHSTSRSLDDSGDNTYWRSRGMNAFVVKLAPNQSSVDYVTQFGGSEWEAVQNLIVDDQGYVYAVGTTYSRNFPATQGVFQTAFGGESDAFVAKLAPDGTPVWTTFLGGSGDEDGRDIAFDSNGLIHIIGRTDSPDFPVAGDPYQAVSGGGTDSFLATFSTDGELLTSTYLGGSGEDIGVGLAVDAGNRLYLTGSTSSDDFPLTHAVQAERAGEADVFVSIMDQSQRDLTFSTYLGGSAAERGVGIGLAEDGEVIIVGQTRSTDLPVTPGAIQAGLNGASDLFVSRILTGDPAIASMTYLGGEAGDRPRRLTVSENGHVIIVGQTTSRSFPDAPRTELPENEGADGFVVELSTDLSELLGSTVVAGSGQDVFEGVVSNPDGTIDITGLSGSADFPMVEPIQSSYSGGRFDIVVVRMRRAGGEPVGARDR